MQSLAQLKRDANSGKMSMLMTERFGKTGEKIPPLLRGVRPVIGANAVAIKLRNPDDASCELRFESAKLLEYDGKTST